MSIFGKKRSVFLFIIFNFSNQMQMKMAILQAVGMAN